MFQNQEAEAFSTSGCEEQWRTNHRPKIDRVRSRSQCKSRGEVSITALYLLPLWRTCECESFCPPNQRSCHPPTYAAIHSCKTPSSFNRRQWSLEKYIGIILQSSFQTLLFISPIDKKEKILPYTDSCVVDPQLCVRTHAARRTRWSVQDNTDNSLGLTGHGTALKPDGFFITPSLFHHMGNDKGLMCCSACSMAMAGYFLTAMGSMSVNWWRWWRWW
jgi:hypothetical protein